MINHKKVNTIAQQRRTKKIITAIDENLTKLESDLQQIIIERINNFRSRLKICEYCQIPYIELRTGRSKFCSDICRSNNRFKND